MTKGGFVKGTDSGLVSDSGFFDCGRYKFVARSRLVSILFWTDYNDPFVVAFQWLQRYASVDRKAANNWCSCSSGGCRGCDHQRPIARSFTFLYFSNNNTLGWFLSHVAVLLSLSNQHNLIHQKTKMSFIYRTQTIYIQHDTFFCNLIFFFCVEFVDLIRSQLSNWDTGHYLQYHSMSTYSAKVCHWLGGVGGVLSP